MIFGLTIFLGAFLLFQVQLILGKAILPWFGGTPAVWSTCLMFFQVLLLLGYAYAHASVSWSTPRRQAGVHVALIALASVVLAGGAWAWGAPLLPGPSWKPFGSAMPALKIVAMLAVCVGIPYLVLSSTSPLLQAWFAKVHPTRSPYRLYALSNAGSLLGLLSYPIVVEPSYGLRAQAWVWGALFVVFAIGSALCATGVPRTEAAVEARREGQRPRWTRFVWWLVLAACGSMMLLSTSNHMGEEISVSPLLWMLPLTIYLLTFILCFEREATYRRNVFCVLFAVAMIGSVWILQEASAHRLIFVVGADLFALFCGCMICHGELVKSKPAPDHLTAFYLMISLGGALGGMLVSLTAPLLFNGYWELQLSLVACALLLLVALVRDRESWIYGGRPHLALAEFALAGGLLWLGRPQIMEQDQGLPASFYWVLSVALFASAAVALLVASQWLRLGLASRRRRWLAIGAVAVVVAYGVALQNTARQFRWARIEYAVRNFYGVQRVLGVGNARLLAHGSTLHGWQRLDRPVEPLGYYGPGTGLSTGLEAMQAARSHLRIAVVGLGAGAIAAYGRPGDTIRFYEIDPDVIHIASGAAAWFTYLGESKANVSVVEGDARLSLERETGRFDVLVLDAFSSDVIPVHLMTRQAFDLYVHHLAPDGLLLLHISNRYLDLGPVVRRLCNEKGLHTAFVVRESQDGLHVPSVWVLATSSAALLRRPPVVGMTTPEHDTGPSLDLWTDDWSNVMQALRR